MAFTGGEEMSIMCMKIKRMGIYNTCVLSIYMLIWGDRVSKSWVFVL